VTELQPIVGGYRLRVTDEYIVDVQSMMFNWRLVVSLPEEDGQFYRHGFCYFGRGPEAMHRAIAAGLTWEDPLNTPPEGFDKQAY
jgi:hypothetical protein